MPTTVLDASAVLAVAFDEPGQDRVFRAVPGCLVSAVNLAEVMAKFAGIGLSGRDGHNLMERLGGEVVAFDRPTAAVCGDIHSRTRRYGLSLADCACLALATMRSVPVLTADRGWSALDIGIEVELIR